MNVTLSVRAIFKNGLLLEYVTALILTRMHLRERLFAGVLLEGGGGAKSVNESGEEWVFPRSSHLPLIVGSRTKFRASSIYSCALSRNACNAD